MMKNVLLFILIVCLGLILLGCFDVSTPQITYKDTQVKFLSFPKMTMTSDFTVNNPNPVGISGIVSYDLFLRNEHFVSGKTNTIDLTPSGKTAFTISNQIDLSKVFGTVANVAQAILNGDRAIPFIIQGEFQADLAGIIVKAPVEASGDIPLPEPPKIELHKLIKF